MDQPRFVIVFGTDFRTTLTGLVGRQSCPTLFTQDAPNVDEVRTYSTNGVLPEGSFVAATQVAIDGGSITIEDVTENPRVLSQASPAAYGIASDEDVIPPVGTTFLCGITVNLDYFTKIVEAKFDR